MDPIKEQLIKPVALGGAPIFVDDLLNIQENAKNSIGPYYESLRKECFRLNESPGGVENFLAEPGLFLTLPEYTFVSDDGVSSSFYAVSECWVWLDGEVCYYPGGTLEFLTDIAAPLSGWAIIKGDPIIDAKVFKDGVNKDLLTTSTVELYYVQEFASGWQVPVQVQGRQAAVLMKSYRKGANNNINAETYYLNHPGWMWDALGTSEIAATAVEAATKSTITLYTPTVESGFVTELTARFYEDGNRMVQGRGVVSCSGKSSGDKILSMSEHTPTNGTRYFPAGIDTTTGDAWWVEMRSDGAYLVNPTANPNSFDGIISFDSISYYSK